MNCPENILSYSNFHLYSFPIDLLQVLERVGLFVCYEAGFHTGTVTSSKKLEGLSDTKNWWKWHGKKNAISNLWSCQGKEKFSRRGNTGTKRRIFGRSDQVIYTKKCISQELRKELTSWVAELLWSHPVPIFLFIYLFIFIQELYWQRQLLRTWVCGYKRKNHQIFLPAWYPNFVLKFICCWIWYFGYCKFQCFSQLLELLVPLSECLQ